jgi:predicted O-methyltransferase YrrM
MVYLFNCNNDNRGLIRQNFDEAALLWKAVKQSKGYILEIGRYKGGSTILISAAAEDRKVFSIDINAPSSVLENYMVGMELLKLSNVILIQGDSKNVDVLKESIGLLFVDGDHSFKGVQKDTELYWPSLEIGGLAVYHDAVEPSFCPGVKKVCDKLIESGVAKQIETAGSSLLLEKLK